MAYQQNNQSYRRPGPPSYQGNSRNGGPQSGRPAPEEVKAEKLPDDYLDRAEDLMRENYRSITTSKIRRLLSLITEIYNKEILSTQEKLAQDSEAAIGMARVRFAYECGRDQKVKDFVKTAHLINYLKGIGDSREKFIQFAQYMEALVAYHKFFGGKEN